MIHNLFDNQTGLGASINEQLAEELHKPVTKEKSLAADLPEMESLSSKNKNVKYLLCATNIFTKYAWVKPLKDKKM